MIDKEGRVLRNTQALNIIIQKGNIWVLDGLLAADLQFQDWKSRQERIAHAMSFEGELLSLRQTLQQSMDREKLAVDRYHLAEEKLAVMEKDLPDVLADSGRDFLLLGRSMRSFLDLHVVGEGPVHSAFAGDLATRATSETSVGSNKMPRKPKNRQQFCITCSQPRSTRLVQGADVAHTMSFQLQMCVTCYNKHTSEVKGWSAMSQ